MKKCIASVLVVFCLSWSAWAQKNTNNVVVVGGNPLTAPVPSQCDADGSGAANCGWETQPPFTGWTRTGDATFTQVCQDAGPCAPGAMPPFVNTGNWALVTGPTGALGCFDQNVPTDSTAVYDLSFALRNLATPNRFQVSWNGSVIYDQTDMPDFAYTSSDALPVGDTSVFIGLTPSGGTTTNLKFCFFNIPDYFYFDDVDVLAE